MLKNKCLSPLSINAYVIWYNYITWNVVVFVFKFVDF